MCGFIVLSVFAAAKRPEKITRKKYTANQNKTKTILMMMMMIRKRSRHPQQYQNTSETLPDKTEEE